MTFVNKLVHVNSCYLNIYWLPLKNKMPKMLTTNFQIHIKSLKRAINQFSGAARNKQDQSESLPLIFTGDQIWSVMQDYGPKGRQMWLRGLQMTGSWKWTQVSIRPMDYRYYI